MKYELMLIMKPDSSGEEWRANIKDVKVVKEELWGKRVLAYPIKHFSEGVYILLNFEAAPAKVKILEKSLNLDEDVLRFLVTRVGEK